jgi:RHS repeat-associated protein
MDAGHRAHRPNHFRSPMRAFARKARWMAPASLVAAAVIYFAVPDPAISQINGRITSTPFSAPPVVDTQTKTPAAPRQVAMPAPPPIKYVPGMMEALVATGPVSDAESKDLDAATAAFHDAPLKAEQGSDYDDYAKPLLAFIAAHPQSNWNAALYTNIGFGYYHAGYYSRAFTSFEKAWQLGRNAPSFQAHLMTDRAVAELARMHARVGHGSELDALFADIGKRPMGGPAVELIKGARHGQWTFKHNPGIGYLCGPKALRNVLITLKGSPKQIKIADDARSGPHGFSLTQLAALADKAKFKYTLIHREAGQPIPVPSIVNWNVHHYAAITASNGTTYEVFDPTLGDGGTSYLTAKAIDAEGSGYFLVPATVMKDNAKSGWRVVAAKSQEAKAIYGMGQVDMPSQNGTKVPDCSTCPNCCTESFSQPSGQAPSLRAGTKGMTTASANTMMVSLNLTDTPVGYRPQIGLPALTQLSYNQKDSEQVAAVPGYSNVSPLWTHTWLVYVVDDPTAAGSTVKRIASAGGGFDYVQHYDSTHGTWPVEPYDNSGLTRTPTSGVATSYERDLPSGGKEFYTLSNGATTYPRLMFLTSTVDPQGNTTTLNYDSQFRLTSVVDAMGRSTTFSYTLAGFPLLITKITDPFGRFTQLNYDGSQRLSSVTDPIGITSSYTYSTTELNFVTQLTTPYGNSTFSDAVPPGDPVEDETSALTLTDALGNPEFLYFYQNPALINPTDPPPGHPLDKAPNTVMDTSGNGLLQWRNTFYWDRHAFTTGVTVTGGNITAYDVSQARLSHWDHFWDIHQGMILSASRVPESTKEPLENRVWYNYLSQIHGYASGALDRPDGTGQTLDDGTPRVYGTNIGEPTPYNPFGLPNNFVDYMGRELHFAYDTTNNVDLLTVAQKTAASTYTTIATFASYVNHRPQTYTGADGQVWHYTYTAAGQIKTVTDPNSGLTTYNYDTSGRLSTIVNADNVTVLKLTYDSADRILTRTDYSAYPTGSGYVLTYAYDSLDRLTKITYPDATTDLYDYTFQSGPLVGTPSLELRKHTDRLSRVTTYGYDADRRLTSVTEPLTATTTRTTNYDYYENGTLKDIIDAGGNDTRWAIDIQSRPTSKTYQFGTASAQTETYAYEQTTSRLHSITDALGQVKTFAYAKDDRVTGITYTASVNATPNVTFVWDTFFPRLSSMTDGTGTTNYSYTAIGTNGALKLSSIAGPYTNDTVGLTYDALGRLSGRTVAGGNETFGYDAISRMNSHVTPLGTFTYGYQGESDLTASRSVTNGSITVSTSWVYDTDANDWRLININNSGVTRSFTLSYLISGTSQNPYDILKITDTAAAGHPWATRAHAYTYDKSDRLLTGTNGTSPYAYDAVDNATTFATTHPTYNGFNQIGTWGALSYVYDADGNLTSGDGVKTYKWDAENRLIEIDYVGTSNKSVFTYNGIGQRISDAETVSGTTTTTRYQWCGTLICQTRSGTDVVQRRDLDEGEFNVTTSQKLVYMPDQLGSVRDVLDATTGTRVQSYDFNPYGAQNRANGSTPTDYRFSRLFLHAVSGLNLSMTRAQDGVTGRWINRDPIREAGGINLYLYADASPIRGLDPWGLATIFGGFGVSIESAFGLEGSFGLLLNPGWDNDCFDIGFFGTGGGGAGVNLGGSLFVGSLRGSSDQMKGGALNVNGTVGPFNTTVILDPRTQQPIGATVGGGIGLPFGASVSGTETGTITLNGLLRKLGFKRCDCNAESPLNS